MQASDPPLTISEHSEQIAGTQTFWRSAPQPPGAENTAPVLYVHGVPTNADDWTPFLQRTGGVALDLPGFGRSEKSQSFEYSIGGYNAFLQAFIGQLGWERFSLVVHDWGALALVTAQELPDRLERLVIINSVPLLPDYRWHRTARMWRTPGLGEFVMGITTKFALRQILREARPGRQLMPSEMVDSIWKHFDHGTQRAILKLYRSAPSEVLEQAGERLGLLSSPTLVLWGEADPYIDAKFAQAFADRIHGAEVKYFPDAGHWAWVDQPAIFDLVAEFVGDNEAAGSAAAGHTAE
ncbi:MAG: alpha/beta hydrolase [Solirubrobacterales bacterium]